MAAESENTSWQLPDPRCRPDQLGQPIPDNQHACSVCMPLWEHNVAYEEGEQAVVSTFRSGYPRFFRNPLIRELEAKLAADFDAEPGQCLLLPSESSARRCAAYVQDRTSAKAEVHETSFGIRLVTTDSAGAPALNEFWQHAGEGISSRSAEACLAGHTPTFDETDEHAAVRRRVAELQHVDADDVYLFPSGMAAIYAAWRITRENDAAPVQFGFPYVDTYKILERFDSQTPLFFPNGSDDDIDELGRRLSSSAASALFCEVPGNPLLRTPDLTRLAALATQHGFAMVVDDTLGAMVNTDVRPWADLIATSLTKFFSGAGDVIAGALVVVPGRPRSNELKMRLEADYENLLSAADAAVLAANSADVVPRVTQINETSAQLVQLLQEHPAVERVYYPSTESPERYSAVRDSAVENTGCGGLLSVLLKNPETTAAAVYDRMRISKGPNLGTNFTLCCPYTILAHYEELEFAKQCGVSPWLLRISVGLEGTDWVIGRIKEALDA